MYYLLLAWNKVRSECPEQSELQGRWQCKALHLLMFPEAGLHIRDDISTLFQSEEMETGSARSKYMTYSSAAVQEHGVRDEDVIS